MKENSKRSSGNALSPLRAQNKDIGTALQTLLIEIKITSATQATELLIGINKQDTVQCLKCKKNTFNFKIATFNTHVICNDLHTREDCLPKPQLKDAL